MSGEKSDSGCDSADKAPLEILLPRQSGEWEIFRQNVAARRLEAREKGERRKRGGERGDERQRETSKRARSRAPVPGSVTPWRFVTPVSYRSVLVPPAAPQRSLTAASPHQPHPRPPHFSLCVCDFGIWSSIFVHERTFRPSTLPTNTTFQSPPNSRLNRLILLFAKFTLCKLSIRSFRLDLYRSNSARQSNILRLQLTERLPA